ncbi:MAG: LacI family transcriptional regulator [Gammaproteobacteria bacterium TMED134]|nr:MAG: LacI family transcriptional regulator [Gammaproteobacteria bacterium TMED134]|tara:strand:- start:216 stop:1247 length:1032 start_codon:yes stop_codon:yes gene_type:complete
MDKHKAKQGRRATSYDVAKLAGVSQSAVSRVYKEGASASPAMRERVMQAATQVGYRPNAIARGLITQRSNMIAVIITHMTNLNYPEVLVELTQAFSNEGIRVLLFTIERESETTGVLDQVLQYQVDGVVAAATLSAKQTRLLEQADIPVIFFNRSLKNGEVSAVRCDQEEGERWLVNQLVSFGHKRFAIISGPEDSVVSVERTSGAIDRLTELGVSQPLIVSGDYSYESGRQAFDKILASHTLPDAIIAANDVMAIGCIDEAEARGVGVPSELSVVGFDGVSPARFAAYDLTTVQQPIKRMTLAAVEMLLERVNDPDISTEERVFAGTKIEGKSARIAETQRQ